MSLPSAEGRPGGGGWGLWLPRGLQRTRRAACVSVNRCLTFPRPKEALRGSGFLGMQSPGPGHQLGSGHLDTSQPAEPAWPTGLLLV